MTKRPTDQLYAKPLQEIVDFTFDESVTHVFADMINRSVPGYANLISMIGIIGAQYAQPNTNLYDLGCSLGACSLSLQHHVQHKDCQLIAVDNAPAMIEQLQQRMNPTEKPLIQPRCSNIQDVDIRNASVVVLNYTLQFIPLAQRQAILGKIYQGMTTGGLLILSEKLIQSDAEKQQTIETLHHEFKHAQGYSHLEIAQKRAALENSMRPETYDIHEERLQKIGFSGIQQWFQCFNFSSILAFK